MKNFLYAIVTIIFLTFLHSSLFAQTSKADEAKTTTKEEPQFEDYGGTVGLGVAIGGGGVIGIPVRIYLKKKVAFEIAYYLRPITVQVYTPNFIGMYDYQIKMPPFIAGGFDFFLGEKQNRNLIVRNGLMLRIGTTIGAHYQATVNSGSGWGTNNEVEFPFNQRMFAFGWARERFLIGRKKQSFVSHLGIGFIKSNGIPSSLGILLGDDDILIDPLLFLKFHWNFILK